MIPVVLFLALAQPSTAILPARWELPKVTVISGATTEQPVEPRPCDELLAALERQAAKKFRLAPAKEVEAAASKAGVVGRRAYGDPKLLEELRKALGVDVLIAPVVTDFDWFSRSGERVVFETEYERRRRVENDRLENPVTETRRPIPARIESYTESGHRASAWAYVCTAKGVQTTRPVASETKGSKMRVVIENKNADALAKKLLDRVAPMLKP